MRVVHKQEMVSPSLPVTYGIPAGARIVGAAFQDRSQTFVFWYERYVEERPFAAEQWSLMIRGTGDPYPDAYRQMAPPVIVNGYVFHLVGKKVE